MAPPTRIGRPPDTSPVKTCTSCNESMPRTAAFFFRRGVASWRSICKACHAKRMAARRATDPEREKSIQRAGYARHREKRKAAQRGYNRREGAREAERAYRKANADRINAKRRTEAQRAKRAAQARKRRERVEYRLRNVLNARLAHCIVRPDRPSDSFVRRFGYTPAELRAHIERCLTGKMSWDNYGDAWEIDHIIPVASFKLPHEIRSCWALTNLRPLLSEQNRAKGDTRLHLM